MQHRPGWIDGAWQVSAVLLGFVVALIVFLLQAAGSRSLRSPQTYRALLFDSFLAWPVALTLVWLAWSAVIERFSASHATPPASWVATWSLGVFLVQLAAFAAVFNQLRKLISPSGVAKTLERAVIHGIRRSCEERLIRMEALQLFLREVQNLGGPSGIPLEHELTTGKAGVIDDIDLALPANLVGRDGDAQVAFLGSFIGEAVSERAVMVCVGTPVTRELTTAFRRGVYLRRHPRTVPDWVEPLQDAIDLGVRALAEGTPRDLDLMTGVILAGLEEIPRTFRRFGRPYSREAVRASVPFGPGASDEDRVLFALARLTHDVFAANDPDATISVLRLTYELALFAVSEDVELALDQAFALSMRAVAEAGNLTPDSARQDAIDQVGRSTYALHRELINRVGDYNLSLHERERSAHYLGRLYVQQTELLKHHADAQDTGSFETLTTDIASQVGRFAPQDRDAQLRAQIERTDDPAERERLRRVLARVNEAEARLQGARETQAWSDFNLGAWIVSRCRSGDISAETWQKLSGYLQHPFGEQADISERLGEMGPGGRVQQLANWEVQAFKSRTITTVRDSPRSDQMATFWAILLMLRALAAGRSLSFEQRERTFLPDLRGRIGEQLAVIENEKGQWEPFVGGDLTTTTQALRELLSQADERETRAELARVAAAPLSDRHIHDFASSAWTHFVETNMLRKRLQDIGAIEVVEDEGAFAGSPSGVVQPRHYFVDGYSSSWNSIGLTSGREAALDEQGWFYDQIARLATDEPTVAEDVPAAIVEAINTLRSAGHRPDTVLIPADLTVRNALFNHPAFRWNRERGFTLGELAGAVVIQTAARGGSDVVVCELAKTIRVRELRQPGSEHAMRTEVRPIDAQRAEEILGVGIETVPGGPVLPRTAQELADQWVECFADLDFELAGEADPTAVRIVRRATSADDTEALAAGLLEG